MATEKNKVCSRSLIPIPLAKTCSLQRLSQTTSTDNLSIIPSKASNITTPGPHRKLMTRHASVSRLPTTSSRSTSTKSCSSLFRPISGTNSTSSDLSPNSNTANHTNINYRKVSPKLFKPNGAVNNISHCQRFQKYHNNANNSSPRNSSNGQKPAANFKIYNKFSPYYENESLEYASTSSTDNTVNSIESQQQQQQNNRNSAQNSTLDFDRNSIISSQESCSSRVTTKTLNENNCAIGVHTDSKQLLYRTQSVPEIIQTQLNSNNNNNNISVSCVQSIDKKSIERLKNKIIKSIDNEDDGQEEEDEEEEEEDADGNSVNELPQNVENKLLRIVIRHLREKLSQSKNNLEKLTQQSTSNKQMCEAFQKSLSAMTIRAQQLTQQLDTKQTEIDNLCLDLKEKNLEIEDWNRRYQLIDNEMKKLQKLNTNLINNNSYENSSRTNSSMSTMSYNPTLDEFSKGSARFKRNSWLRGSTISKAFKRKKKSNHSSKSSLDTMSTKLDTMETISELRDMIREKELTIDNLKMQSLATTNRLERLEDDLKFSREESSHLKKNKEFLEKMMKMKIIE